MSACRRAGEEAVAVRDRYNTFVERHEIAWELAMGGLALVWVALGFLVDQIGSGVRPELETIELLLTGVFIAEFVSRLTAAHDRPQYVRGHWIDALALALRSGPSECSASCGSSASSARSRASIARRCTCRARLGTAASLG
jgi:hypothetical protein